LEGCGIVYPGLEVFEEAVRLLGERYPGDAIEWKGGGREQVLQAVAAARWAFRAAAGRGCLAAGLAAAATLFYEIVTLHPLVDGNKRLATLMLDAFLIVNGLPRPGEMACAALRVAGGEWGREEVYRWLARA